MTHNSVTSNAFELPPQVVDTPPTLSPAPAEMGEVQYTRRAALRLVGRTIAVVGAGKLVLDANAPVAAEAQPETEPIGYIRNPNL